MSVVRLMLSLQWQQPCIPKMFIPPPPCPFGLHHNLPGPKILRSLRKPSVGALNLLQLQLQQACVSAQWPLILNLNPEPNAPQPAYSRSPSPKPLINPKKCRNPEIQLCPHPEHFSEPLSSKTANRASILMFSWNT